MTKIIGIFDHDNEPSLNKLGKLALAWEKIKEDHYSEVNILRHDSDKGAKDELLTSDIAIAHMDPEWFDKLAGDSGNNKVLMRVSTQGIRGMKSYKTENGVYCLYLVPPHDSGDIDWLLLLHAITDENILNSIVSGNVPLKLQRYFKTNSEDNLIALFILCQGYLVAYASLQKLSGGEYGIQKIKKSLDKMGYFKLISDESTEEIIRKAATGYNEKNPDGVLNKNWWSVFSGNIKEAISNELISQGVDESKSKCIKDLVSKIQDDGQIKDPELVADAYLEMVEQKNMLG